MTMVKRNRLRSARPKAVFGIDGAINAAATLMAAGMNAAAIAKHSKEQAESMKVSAEREAEALKLRNENDNKNQQAMIEFTRRQNELERKFIEDIQMGGQFKAGNQNHIQMQEAGKIQLRNGGSARRRLRASNGYDASLLRGFNSNLPFTVTDGGGVIPLGSTPEGYDLYEIIGNDHEHRHQSRNGSSKTGVGIKFAGGDVIEGEGNQNTNQGEYMLVTPNDAKFISKHTIRGINPVELVNEGMHPLQAFNIQERIKDAYNISDSGKYAKIGRSLKRCGGRRKAPNGTLELINTLNPIKRNYISSYYPNTNIQYLSDSTFSPSDYVNYNYYKNDISRNLLNTTAKGNLWGAGFNTLGNIGGTLLNNWGNNRALSYMIPAIDESTNILTDAYSKLGGIDMNLLNRNMFRSGHAMAALQAPIINTGAERSANERALLRTIDRTNRSTLSSAAAQNRNARALIDYQDRLAAIESNANKLRQNIIQGNMDRLTNTSIENAKLDLMANQTYGQAYMNMLQYNNDIENEKIIGAAQVESDAINKKAELRASTKQTNMSNWGNTFNTIGNTFGNTLMTNAKMAHELEMSKYGWSAENNLNWTIRNADLNEAKMLYKRYKGAGGQYDIWATQLEDAFGINNLKS